MNLENCLLYARNSRMKSLTGFPRWCSGKEPICQCRRLRFDPWVRKIPWRRKWQPTPAFLPGTSTWTEEPGGLHNLWGCKESDMTEHARTTTSLTLGNKMPLGGYSSIPWCVHVTGLTQNRVAQRARLCCRGASECSVDLEVTP